MPGPQCDGCLAEIEAKHVGSSTVISDLEPWPSDPLAQVDAVSDAIRRATAAHNDQLAALTAQVAALTAEREELCKMVDRCVGDVPKGNGGLYGLGCQAINSHRRGAHDVGSMSVESAKNIEGDARALVRRIRGGA